MSRSFPDNPQDENPVFSDGPEIEQAAELIPDLVHHDDAHDAHTSHSLRRERSRHLPWWKTPSPWWLLSTTPFLSIVMSATLAPRIEVYTLLVCSVHKPDIFHLALPNFGNAFNSLFDLLTDPIAPMPTFSANDTHLIKEPNACASDPIVQAEVAKLTVVISACMGILSCLSTGWWGSFSDRYGRTLVIGISTLGLLLADFNFIFVALHFRRLPGSYWFLVAGPIIEGCLGGFSTAVAASQAYIADTCPEATRSRIFSLNLGLLFVGVALGPSLGAVLIRFTGGILSIFYATASLHLFYLFLVSFIFPESLLYQQMQQSRDKYKEQHRDTSIDHPLNSTIGFLVRLKRLFTFLSPLLVFLPVIKEKIYGNSTPLERRRRDWNLTLLVAGYGLICTVMGSYNYTFQYAAYAFAWNSETIGYWLSLVGATRAVFLTLVLPIFIKLFKPRPLIIEVPVNPAPDGDCDGRQLPFSNSPSNIPASSSPYVGPQPKMFKEEIYSPTFDIGLALGSLFIDIVSYTSMTLVPNSTAFTLSTLFLAFGAGYTPAVQSIALAMYTRRGGTESGKLFGALSVMQALCSQILGPAIYGLVYIKTVAVFSRAIFSVTVGMCVISFALLALVRSPGDGGLSVSDSRRDDFTEDEEFVEDLRGL